MADDPQALLPFDYAPTVLAQYANSPTIMALVEDISEWLDPAADLNAFYAYVWNIDTAQGFGLDIWGRIVGVSRVFPISNTPYFGFEESTEDLGFGQAPFWSGTPDSTNFALSDEAYRQLILAKALSNIIDGSIPAINRLLMLMFPGRGNAYVVDNVNMTLKYKFEFVFTPVDLTLVVNSGVLPHPAGVQVFEEHD